MKVGRKDGDEGINTNGVVVNSAGSRLEPDNLGSESCRFLALALWARFLILLLVLNGGIVLIL